MTRRVFRWTQSCPRTGGVLYAGAHDSTGPPRQVMSLQYFTTLEQEHPETRTEASRALRGLIDAIVLTPKQGEPPSRAGKDSRFGEPRLQMELKGNLAAMCGRADAV